MIFQKKELHHTSAQIRLSVHFLWGEEAGGPAAAVRLPGLTHQAAAAPSLKIWQQIYKLALTIANLHGLALQTAFSLLCLVCGPSFWAVSL